MRFNKSLRLLGSILFTIAAVCWLPIVIYVPALAFNQVTGINVHIINMFVCTVCIFYTCVGGLKAVVWTDVIQTVIMVGAIIVVIIKGTCDVGGLGVVWQRNVDSGRVELPTMTMDITERMSMLGVFIGGSFYSLQSASINQVILQRYLAVPGVKEARQCCLHFMILFVLLSIACYYNGLLLFAYYHDCDPISTGLIKKKDQLVPLLFMDLLRNVPGMPGIFVAGVMSAGLSSMSTALNSLAAVILEDYIKPLRKTRLTERQTATIMRMSVVLIGILSTALVFVVERLGTIVQLQMTLSSISSGPLLGLFLIGVIVPWINGKSALFGTVLSFFIMAWISVQGRLALNRGELVYPEKFVTTAGCNYTYDAPLNISKVAATYLGPQKFVDYIYHMSFIHYVVVGTMTCIGLAGLSGLWFGYNDISKMNLKLLMPAIRRFIKPAHQYQAVSIKDQSLQMASNAEEPS